MESYETKVKTLYKVISRVYDLMDIVIFPYKKTNPRKCLADQLPNEHARILDACCGTGNSTLEIARKNKTNTVIGIDLSSDMLKVARGKALKHKISNASFHEMNASKMDFPSGSFDVATISLAFHEMPQELINSILVEMGRVLKPSGMLYIVDWDRPKRPIALILFKIFPSIIEPKVFKLFLRINWMQLLDELGYKYIDMEHYTFTKLIVASKEGEPTLDEQCSI